MFKTILRVLAPIGLGLLIAVFLIMAVGESPLRIAGIFYEAVFGSSYGLGMTLFYALPLACTGLAFSIGLRSNLFNIGLEGQLAFAALAAALTGLFGPQEVILNRILGLLAALGAGFLWASILAYLRAKRNAHEVVSGIMMNFIAWGICSWLALNYFRNTESQNPETTPIAEGIRFAPFEQFQPAPVGWHVLVVPLLLILVWAFYRYTRLGYAMEVAGVPNDAAQHAAMSLPKLQFWALSLGGMVAGAVGFLEVYGNSVRYIVGFSPGYGFTGIAVALVGRGRPLGIALGALLFGALQVGSMDLDFESEFVTRDFALILQALIILFMSCRILVPVSWQKAFLRLFRRSDGNPA